MYILTRDNMKFDNAASSWDDDKRIKRAKLISEEISKVIKSDKSYNAMEFGCGTGLISFNLRDKFESIALIDTSEGMINVLNSKIKDHQIDNMKAYVLDINKNRDKLGKYDVIYTSMALHHVLDIKTTVETFFSLLNPKGQLCIVDLDKEDGSFHGEEKDFNGHNGFDQEELSNLLRDCGFKGTSSRIIYSGEKVVGNKNVKYSLFLMKGEK